MFRQDKVDPPGGRVGPGAQDLHGRAQLIDGILATAHQPLGVLVQLPPVIAQSLHAYHTLDAVCQSHKDAKAGHAGDGAREGLANVPGHILGHIELFDLPFGVLSGHLPL